MLFQIFSKLAEIVAGHGAPPVTGRSDMRQATYTRIIERQNQSLDRHWMLESMEKLLVVVQTLRKKNYACRQNKIERKRQVLGTRGTWTLATLKIRPRNAKTKLFLQEGIFGFSLMYVIQHCYICHPSHSTVSEDAGIEPRTVATLARCSTLSKNINNFPVPSRDVTNGDYSLAGNNLINPRQGEFG